MITNLRWQWQSATNDLANVSTSQSTKPSTYNQRGRVITGMLTGSDEFQDPAKRKGRG
jgi:hypothetical protein